MKNKIPNTSSTPLAMNLHATTPRQRLSRITSRFTRSLTLPSSRFTFPLGSLGDPTLLERLHLPLTRERY
jgi:hypothetical protein